MNIVGSRVMAAFMACTGGGVMRAAAPIWADAVWPRDYNAWPPHSRPRDQVQRQRDSKAQPSLCELQPADPQVALPVPSTTMRSQIATGGVWRQLFPSVSRAAFVKSRPNPSRLSGFRVSTVTRNSDPLHRIRRHMHRLPDDRQGRGIIPALPRASRSESATPSATSGTTPPCGRATPDTPQRCRR